MSVCILGEATLKEIQAALHDIAQAQLDMQRLEGNNSEFTFCLLEVAFGAAEEKGPRVAGLWDHV